MKKIVIILCLIFSLCNLAYSDVYDHPAKVETIIKNLPELNNIRCDFKQEKYLKNVSKPLVSGGDFEFKKNSGVYFYTKYPVISAVDYTDKNYKQVNDIINAISSKKYSRLEKEFNFFFSGSKDKWTLGLKPKEESKAFDYISSVTVNGENYIRQITINQTNGNKTVLWFSM